MHSHHVPLDVTISAANALLGDRQAWDRGLGFEKSNFLLCREKLPCAPLNQGPANSKLKLA